MEKDISIRDTYSMCCLHYKAYIRLLIFCGSRHICFLFFWSNMALSTFWVADPWSSRWIETNREDGFINHWLSARYDVAIFPDFNVYRQPRLEWSWTCKEPGMCNTASTSYFLIQMQSPCRVIDAIFTFYTDARIFKSSEIPQQDIFPVTSIADQPKVG